MKFTVKDALTEDEVQKGLAAVIKDGVTTQAMAILTGGVFLIAFALELGASNFVIGLLAAISPLSGLIQIPSVYLVEKFRIRKALCVYASIAARLCWLLIAAIPFLFSPQAGLVILIGALVACAAFGAVGACSWNSWMRDLIPGNRLGLFFSKRMFFAAGLGIVLSGIAGIYIDSWRSLLPAYSLHGYSVLFAFGCIAGMLGVYYIAVTPEPRMETGDGRPRFLQMIAQPFRDQNFKSLIAFMGSWNFAINLATPFFTVYMLRLLQMDMSSIVALVIVSQITNFAFLRLWGRFSDRFSNKSVLGVSGPLYLLCIIAWTFTTMPEKHIFTIPLLIGIHILMGISTAGVSLASGNISLKLAPRGQATSYLASNNFVNSLAAGIAPILGGALADFFAVRELDWTLTWAGPGVDISVQTLSFQHWDFLFFFAFVIGLYSLHRLTLVRESGEVREKVVVEELFSEVRKEVESISTAEGIRSRFQLPAFLNPLRKKRGRA
jgi:MFS family permease